MSSPPTPSSPAQPPSQPVSGRGSRPGSGLSGGRRLRWLAAVLVGVEAVGLLVLAGWVVVAGFVRGPASWVYVIWIAGLAFVTGAALLLVARGLAGGRSWSRAPAVLTQLLVITVAYEPLQALPAVRWPILGFAALTFLVVITSAVYRRDEAASS